MKTIKQLFEDLEISLPEDELEKLNKAMYRTYFKLRKEEPRKFEDTSFYLFESIYFTLFLKFDIDSGFIV